MGHRGSQPVHALPTKAGGQSRVTAATLRFRLFTTGGIISNRAGRTPIWLGVPEEQRQWWREVLTKL